MNFSDTTIFKVYNIASIQSKEVNSSIKGVINTLNAYSFVLAEKNNLFKQSLINSDILLPDGFPIVLATRLLTGKKIRKIAGEDIHFHLLKQANMQGQKVMYLGSSVNTLSKIQDNLKAEYPQLKVFTYSPPYKQHFNDDDNQQMIQAVNGFEPDILFVGMTAPKQEIWAYEHKTKLNATTICCIGAVFDFYAGTVKRAPQWMISCRLEWFYRLVKEPRRMWRRYLVYSPLFFVYLFSELIKHWFGRLLYGKK